MPLEIIRNDITKVKADAIVNTANPMPTYGPGVDEAIYIAAGKEELLKEREKIGAIFPGEIALTPAFDLDAKYIIHAVGPAWQGGDNGEEEVVSSCYRKALSLAEEKGCESIAFPLISAGNYGFPKDLALNIAISEITSFLLGSDMTVYLVVYDKEVFQLSSKLFNDIAELIGDEDIKPRESSRLNSEYLRRRENRKYSALLSLNNRIESPILSGGHAASSVPMQSECEPGSVSDFEMDSAADSIYGTMADVPELSADGDSDLEEGSQYYEELSAGWSSEFGLEKADSQSLDDMLKHKELTFQEHLFRIIDKKGMSDVEVYKKANIDRKHFSKIKSNADYKPSKKTAVAFAIALGLNLDETQDLLLRAGVALSNSSNFDIIVQYCIQNHVTDINEINCILFKYNEPLLGA